MMRKFLIKPNSMKAGQSYVGESFSLFEFTCLGQKLEGFSHLKMIKTFRRLAFSVMNTWASQLKLSATDGQMEMLKASRLQDIQFKDDRGMFEQEKQSSLCA